MVSNTLMHAILAMDSYNPGYNEGLKHNQNQIGSAVLSQQSDISAEGDAVAAGFYAVAYNYDGQTVISYRGTEV